MMTLYHNIDSIKFEVFIGVLGVCGGAVGVEALCYKPESREFDS
jgi:hypothetical protein